MPERIAATDPFKQITEYVGSGPMRFVRNEWVPGAKAVFEKFAGYVPRQNQRPGSPAASGSLLDRIEWIVMPDQATAAAALQNGEIDWWESPIPDLVPLLRKNRNVWWISPTRSAISAAFRMNHLFPPFNDVRARRAILMAMSQEDYMRALVGDDDHCGSRCPAFSRPAPRSTPRRAATSSKGRATSMPPAAAGESGYAGAAGHLPGCAGPAVTKAWGDITADLLKRLGMNVDLNAIDWGTVGARRAAGIAAGPGRLADVPHLAFRCRLHQSGGVNR